MATPREHIEEIRTKKFNIGGEPGPTSEDLHHAVNYLSAELYSKDVHFLMELIQNAEDNEYLDGVKPSLEFVITSRDITATGASATLLVFNNEKGFSPKNIESICSVGRSTKKGFRKRGYIGEKGIGFKSVFLITAQPYIFSNGYQIRFNEEPCSQCHVGYIVPEWVEDNPTLSTIKQIYGTDTSLPTTTIVLPLKPDKVKPVKQQLSSIHPEVLLFLSKIKKLSIKEDNEDPRLNSVSAISISSETEFERRKNIDAESYMLHLSSDENGDNSERECSYFMWKQRFPVKPENKVKRRMEVEEWVLTLAFPNGERLSRGMNSPGVYAFLPTEMASNFPFIIQADFLLASSRETILMDNKWNQGILGCIPSAFVNAFISLVKTLEDAPVSSLPPMFRFLPINISPYPELNAVREKIKGKVMDENIVPCESYTEQKIFQKPVEVGRLLPAFWNILINARKQSVNLDNISSHGRYVLSSSFDRAMYNPILNFLGIEPVEDEWYTKCIRGSNLVMGVTEEVYLDLLLFLAEKWRSNFHKTSIKNLPLLKCVSSHGDISLKSVMDVSLSMGGKVLISREPCHISWLIDWNREFRGAKYFFLPEETQAALHLCSKRQTMQEWLLNEAKIEAVNVYEYGILIYNSLDSDKDHVVTYVHFLYHSLSANYMFPKEVDHLCDGLPLVDKYRQVSTIRSGVLVPAIGSKWLTLIGSNPWRGQGFVELGEDYLHSRKFASVHTPEKQLISFLKTHLSACDVPNISPPNVEIPTMSAQLTKQNTFLLLDWIRSLKCKRIHMPDKFLTCIKKGRWMRVSLSGSGGNRSPSESFLTDSTWGHLLQSESVFVDIPMIDKSFYGSEIYDYKEELRSVGVMFECGEACRFIGEHLMNLASSSTLTKGNVLSMLKFIKFLQENYLTSQDFIRSIKERRWIRTSVGDKSPAESVLYSQEWRAASQISDIPFIDEQYYGEEILSFKAELKMLGVIVGFDRNYDLVFGTLKSSAYISGLTSESCLFVLECLHHLRSPDKFVGAFKDLKFLKTNMGVKSPVESYLFNPEWGCLLQIFNSFPLIDQNSYGSSFLLYKTELKQLGVVVDFEEATKAFARVFKQQAALIKKDAVLSFLACCRKLQETPFKFPEDLKSCIREVEWLRTRLGDYRVPKGCILFGPDWESICPISRLPFIDDGENYYGKGIHEFKKELKSMGVVLAFKNGCHFVADGLHLPCDPDNLTPANVYSLLDYVRNLHQRKEHLPDPFLKKISKRWLKTCAGYRSPDNCLLFDSDWNSFLHQEDGPFIDEEYYGSEIKSYSKELNSIGVTVEVGNGCSLLATHLAIHSNFSSINRIYRYLCAFNWESDCEERRKIWIPNGSDDGQWAISEECVLSDKNDLFGMQLNVLEKHYDKKLLDFFSYAFGVRRIPSVDDYCKLWKAWESSGRPLSYEQCCAFWQCVVKHWSSETRKKMDKHLVKLPVYTASGGVNLWKRSDVFIADDLQLKDLFEQSSSQPLFAWYPQPSVPSLPRGKLLEVYSEIGVRNISESVLKEEVSLRDATGITEVVPRENLIRKGLVKLILGFLADLSLEMEAHKRHEAVQSLLDITVLETVDPITIGYSLPLSSGEILKGEARRMIRWERDSKKFFTQKMERSDGRSMIEYATRLSEAISEGLLWEKEDHMQHLAELIKLGFLVEFDEEAIEFLMKAKNLQLFSEDETFLSSVFLSD